MDVTSDGAVGPLATDSQRNQTTCRACLPGADRRMFTPWDAGKAVRARWALPKLRRVAIAYTRPETKWLTGSATMLRSSAPLSSRSSINRAATATTRGQRSCSAVPVHSSCRPM